MPGNPPGPPRWRDPADITEVAILAISGTVGAEVVQVSPAPDLMDVSSLGVRQSDGQSILRKPNTMRWAALDHLNLEETVISQAKRPIRPLVTEQQVRDELDRHHQDLDDEQHQAVITLLTAYRAMALLTAPAGAGKTRTIAAAATVWHALTGGRLIGLTLSENAARVMTAEGLPEAYNIARFLGKCPDRSAKIAPQKASSGPTLARGASDGPAGLTARARPEARPRSARRTSVNFLAMRIALTRCIVFLVGLSGDQDEKGGAEHVREIHRPGTACCGPGPGRGQDAQPQLHRHRAHPARPPP